MAPEVEDHYFEPSHARYHSEVPPDNFWKMLDTIARPTLAELFGADLHQSGYNCSVARGKGSASLGCVRPRKPPLLTHDTFGKLRMRLSDGIMTASVPVTDIRLFKEDHKTIRDDVVADLNRRIAKGVRVILSVGLSRPFAKSPGGEERHWLQVNSIHLEDHPVWQVAGEPESVPALVNLDDLPF